LIGSLSIGFCAQHDLNPSDIPVVDGLIFSGNAHLLGVQALAIVITIAHSALFTAAIALVLKYTIGLKITTEEEDLGLDYVEHAEQAYRFHKINDEEGNYDEIHSDEENNSKDK